MYTGWSAYSSLLGHGCVGALHGPFVLVVQLDQRAAVLAPGRPGLATPLVAFDAGVDAGDITAGA